MTPEEFVVIEKEQQQIIQKARNIIDKARDEAEESKMPTDVRPAKAGDIVQGAIIWHNRADEYGGPYWNVVEDVLRPSDLFKAYCADDGCRYGLHKAFISL